jgi:Haem-binding domain
MKKILKIAVVVVIVVIIALQFFKPDTVNPVEDKSKFISAKYQIPDNVLQRLEKSCFDCHSYRTKWPWYSNISPVVYLINRDVKEGRKHLNFSVWTDYDKARMIKKLDGIVTEVKDGEMPMSIYLPMHPEAKISDTDAKMLMDWAKNLKDSL